MIASAHQPAWIPWLGLIHKIASAETFISFDDVAMEGSGHENRNRVLTATGQQWLTVPVRRDIDTKIKDVAICRDQPWRRKQFRTLELAYSKAPYWKEHEPMLRAIYGREDERLVDLNAFVLSWMLDYFRLDHVKINRLSSFGLTSTKSHLVLDACKVVGAKKYIFGAMGKDYADVAAFNAAGVEPWIQEYISVPYPQMQPGFVPNLSAVDLMLNVPRSRAIEIMRAGGTVKRLA